MENLLNYINDMSPAEQEAFAERCGTSIGYIRKAISTGQKFGEGLCMSFEEESAGAVTCEHLRPDLLKQWAYIRGTKPIKLAA